MNGLPDGFKLLDGVELEQAVENFQLHVTSLQPQKIGRIEGLHALARPLNCTGGLDAREEHISALCGAAESIGDQAIWLAMPLSMDAGDVGVLAIDVAKFPEFCASLDFGDLDDSLVPKVASDWPERAKKIAFPDLELASAVLSPTGRWGQATSDLSEYVVLSGSADFIESYRAARPESIYDLLCSLYSLAGWMIDVEGARTGGFLRKRRGDRRPTRDDFVRRLMESVYAPHDSEWIWDLFCETFMDGYAQTSFEGWKKWEERLFDHLGELPGANDRLVEIWRTSRPR